MSKYQVDQDAYVKYLLGLDSKTTDSKVWEHAHALIYGDDKHDHNSELYVELMNQASQRTDNPVLRCWFKIEMVNALRRIPTKATVQQAGELLTEVRPEIDALNSPRKKRLLNLWGYQGGETYHLSGEFDKAARSHELSASVADTERDRIHGNYMAAYEWLNAALVSGHDIELRFKEFLVDLCHFLIFFLCTGDADDQYSFQWKGNLVWDLILYNFLVTGNLPSKFDIKPLEKLPDNLQKAFAEATIVASALAQLEQNPKKAFEIASSKSGQWECVDHHSIALLVQAEAFFRAHRQLEGIEKLKEITVIFKDALGGYVARAIAQRKLI